MRHSEFHSSLEVTQTNTTNTICVRTDPKGFPAASDFSFLGFTDAPPIKRTLPFHLENYLAKICLKWVSRLNRFIAQGPFGPFGYILPHHLKDAVHRGFATYLGNYVDKFVKPGCPLSHFI